MDYKIIGQYNIGIIVKLTTCSTIDEKELSITVYKHFQFVALVVSINIVPVIL